MRIDAQQDFCYRNKHRRTLGLALDKGRVIRHVLVLFYWVAYHQRLVSMSVPFPSFAHELMPLKKGI